jgi:hypothetical protein
MRKIKMQPTKQQPVRANQTGCNKNFYQMYLCLQGYVRIITKVILQKYLGDVFNTSYDLGSEFDWQVNLLCWLDCTYSSRRTLDS